STRGPSGSQRLRSGPLPFDRQAGEVHPGADLQLAEDLPEMEVDGVGRQEHLLRRLAVGEARGWRPGRGEQGMRVKISRPGTDRAAGSRGSPRAVASGSASGASATGR